MPRGEKNKLSKTDILEIFNLKGVTSAYYVAKEFGVSHTMIYKIWKSPEKYLRHLDSPRLDTRILMKLIPLFAKAEVKVKLEPEEIARIQQLAGLTDIEFDFSSLS